MRIPDLILAADFHLRETHPICRLDDFVDITQWVKVDFIAELQAKYNCPIILAGDLYDHWKPSPELITNTIIHLPRRLWTIYGNHDLPQHSMQLVHKCGINTLSTAGTLAILHKGINWNERPEDKSIWEFAKRKILVWHVYNWQTFLPWPGCTAPTAAKLLRDYPQYDLIVTGDNHKPFVEKYQGRLLVNPGSIFRMDADQADHKPRVYLWYADTNEVEPVFLPIKNNVITREHIEVKEKHDERINHFLSQLQTQWSVTTSFEQNLEIFKQNNNPRESVMSLVYKATE